MAEHHDAAAQLVDHSAFLAERTFRCSATMPSYWTGISQPPKSMQRAPSPQCESKSGVRLGMVISPTSR